MNWEESTKALRMGVGAGLHWLQCFHRDVGWVVFSIFNLFPFIVFVSKLLFLLQGRLNFLGTEDVPPPRLLVESIISKQ